MRQAFFRIMLFALILCAAPALAGVIRVDVNSYRLDGGKPVPGPWEIAEKLATADDVAIVVMEPQATPFMVQSMLQLLETLKVPTVLTKSADYKAFVDRGLLTSAPAP